MVANPYFGHTDFTPAGLYAAGHMLEVIIVKKDTLPQSPARYLQNFAKKYGVQDLHPHKLRHSFASIAITNGADIASVSEKLGHTDKAVTLRMYAHADQESIKRASQIFQDAIKQA